MFFIQYFGLTVMGIVGIICFATLATNNTISKKQPKQPLVFMPSPPKAGQLWKNIFDDTKVKVVYCRATDKGNRLVTIVEYVKEGEEQLLSSPQELFMNQYVHTLWNPNPTI